MLGKNGAHGAGQRRRRIGWRNGSEWPWLQRNGFWWRGWDSGWSCGDTPPHYCVPTWCGGDVVASPSCSETGWVCAENWISEDECPSDACFHTPEFCCDAHGNFSAPKCPNHGAAVCTEDTYLAGLGLMCASAGHFPCAWDLECKLGEELCKLGPNGSYACEPLPPACTDCGCLADDTCACEDTGIGAFKLYCV